MVYVAKYEFFVNSYLVLQNIYILDSDYQSKDIEEFV